MSEGQESRLLRERLDRETDRERVIIGQSNARAAAIAQLLAAVVGAVGIAVAIILPRDNVRMTLLSVWVGAAALVLVVVMLVGLVVVMWPRGLHNLAHDADEEAFRQRLNAEAFATVTLADPTPALDEFQEGFLLQRIARRKEAATRVTLVGIGLFVPVSVLFFVCLRY